MPIGAFVASQEIMQVLSHHPILGHITTFGGHPVSCVAGMAALEVLMNNNLIGQVKEKEALFRQLLQHEKIKAVRSAGLMIAVELGKAQLVQDFCQKAYEKGLLTDWFLFNETSFRIAPPLTITKNEIEKSIAIMLRVLDNL